MGKFALLIGNSAFQDDRLNQLYAPPDDVQELIAVLKDKNIGGFDRISTVFNSTLVGVQQSLFDFLADRSKEDLILVYYTGHGLTDDRGRLYLALTGTNPEYPAVGSLEGAFLKRLMDECRSEPHS